MTQTRAADDFATIRARMKELAREADAASENPAGRSENRSTDHERRQKERREGHPPPWAPTIFTKPIGSNPSGRR